MNQFLSISDLAKADILALLQRACELERKPINDALYRKVIGLLFMNPSLRTLASFQAGIGQMGGTSVVVQPGNGSWALENRDGVVMDGEAQEHVKEAIPVLASYCDVLAIRSFARQADLDEDLSDQLMKRMASLSQKPVVNMESASDHPCQALADWKTLDDLEIPETGKFVLCWAYHPKPLPYAVPKAALWMAAQRGMQVTVVRPKGFELPKEVMQGAEALSGHKVEETEYWDEGMTGAEVLYCKSWASTGFYDDPQDEQVRRSELRHWCVQESHFRTAKPGAKFMHCLPVRRNVKVSDEVLDGPRSVVFRQAKNRLHVQKSVLVGMTAGGHTNG